MKSCIYIGPPRTKLNYGMTGVAKDVFDGRLEARKFRPHGTARRWHWVNIASLYFPKDYTPTRPAQKKDL